MTGSVRRSNRERKKNTRYSNDVFADLNDVPLSPELDYAETEALLAEQDSLDEDFDRASIQAEEEEEEEENADVIEEDAGSGASVDLEYDERDDPEVDDEKPFPLNKRQRKRTTTVKEIHHRGLIAAAHTSGKDVSAFEVAGGDPTILNFLNLERTKWTSLISLPTRKMMPDGSGGMQQPFVYTIDLQNAEKQKLQAWYEDQGGSEVMQTAQTPKCIDSKTGTAYLPSNGQNQTVYLGPYGNQKPHELSPSECLSLKEAWQSVDSESEINGADTQRSSRDGWVLNLGRRILWMEWAPRVDSKIQYLAVAVAIDPPSDQSQHSPFVPSEPYKSSIQIWAFRSRDGDGEKLMDLSQRPQLVQVVCTEWGALRRVYWCPVVKPAPKDDQDLQNLGLLAVISTDGYLRILDIKINCKENDTYGKFTFDEKELTEAYRNTVKYHGAAFESKPPDTVCTCASWLSATQIAAGCANGYVAVWNVADCILAQRNDHPRDGGASNKGLDSSTPCPPFFYHSLHTSYILNINGHYPFPSHYLTTSSADGRVRLTSLRRPQADSIVGLRSRNLPSFLTYSPHVLGVITTDENDGVRCLALRQFFSGKTVARSQAQVVCVDAAKTHPCLLIGSSDGSVIIANILRRLFVKKHATELRAWQQTWFRHEWISKDSSAEARIIPGSSDTGGSSEEDEVSSDEDNLLSDSEEDGLPYRTRSGNCRFLESFKLQPASFSRNPTNAKSSSKKTSKPSRNIVVDGGEGPSTTIYEEEQAVTSVAWNPNPDTGGWAAAGMASGLIRVEDLGI